MKIAGIIVAVFISVIVVLQLYRRLAAGKYTKTTGEIINFKNMLPLVNKTMVHHKGKYRYSECRYQGDAFVVVGFPVEDGPEITRRFNVSQPLDLKINEHRHLVPQFTAVFPEWRIGKKVKVFYDPADTTDIFVGRNPPMIGHRLKKLF